MNANEMKICQSVDKLNSSSYQFVINDQEYERLFTLIYVISELNTLPCYHMREHRSRTSIIDKSLTRSKLLWRFLNGNQ